MRIRLSVAQRTWLLKSLILGGPILGLVLILHFVLPGVKSSRDKSRFEADEGTQIIETENFTVYSKHSAEYSQELADHLQAFYSKFLTQAGEQLGIHSEKAKASVYLFRDALEFQTWSIREFHNPFVNNGGFYDPSTREIGSIAKGVRKVEDLAGCFHEAIHLAFGVATVADQQISPWLAEGTAVYFGDAAEANGQDYQWGAIPEPNILNLRLAHLKGFLALNAGKAFVELLLSTDQSNFYSESNEVFYSGSYLLVHYLLHGESGRFRDQFESYVRLELQTGRPISPWKFYNHFEVEPDEFEASWRRYVADLKITNSQ